MSEEKLPYQSEFQNYPNAEQLFITSDGYAFLDASHANAHASGLKEKAVKAVTRASFNASVDNGKSEEDTNEEFSAEAIKVADMTVAEITEWANGQDNADVLTDALQYTELKGGTAAITARIESLTKD